MSAIYARPPTDEERRALRAGLKSEHGITVRRSQIILLSADQQLKAGQIGKQLGLSDQLVRNVLHAFNHQGTACLQPGGVTPVRWIPERLAMSGWLGAPTRIGSAIGSRWTNASDADCTNLR